MISQSASCERKSVRQLADRLLRKMMAEEAQVAIWPGQVRSRTGESFKQAARDAQFNKPVSKPWGW